MRFVFELAQVIERFGCQFANRHQPNGYVLRTLHAIRSCRTASLGGHVDRCDSCGYIRVSYNPEYSGPEPSLSKMPEYSTRGMD